MSTDELTTDEAKAIRPMQISNFTPSEPGDFWVEDLSGRRDVEDAALVAIQEQMSNGFHKHGPTKWRHETEDEHLLKAARHIMTAMQIAKGVTPDDGDNHLAAAVTRVSMAIHNRKQCSRSGAIIANSDGQPVLSADNPTYCSRSVSGAVPCH